VSDKEESRLRGYHLMLEGTAEKPASWTAAGVETLLRRAVEVAEMKLIAGPVVREQGGQICGVAVLAESHVTVHAWPSAGRVFADLFSCKEFALGHVVDLFVEGLALERETHYVMNRSLPDEALPVQAALV
jgi:S-adenosylmethionine decarboxylase